MQVSHAWIGQRILEARADAALARAAAAASDSAEGEAAAIRIAEQLESFADTCIFRLGEINGRAAGRRPPV